ncbi:hypothetical protein Zmor_016363 [Zophobas morio]|jgi:hypothetical protein|uniref:Uncharacterized protein n=1 Tax=Zophobas morio TaxID=2755281 RepID=A0AA38LZE5_9CUCU|nr:hypothetical protein Zmor_016363 [Zophobas morio]
MRRIYRADKVISKLRAAYLFSRVFTAKHEFDSDGSGGPGKVIIEVQHPRRSFQSVGTSKKKNSRKTKTSGRAIRESFSSHTWLFGNRLLTIFIIITMKDARQYEVPTASAGASSSSGKLSFFGAMLSGRSKAFTIITVQLYLNFFISFENRFFFGREFPALVVFSSSAPPPNITFPRPQLDTTHE